MPKFRIRGEVTVSVFKVVEAATEADALNVAARLAMPYFCHQCESAGKGDPETWQFNGELDGEAVNTEATPVR